MSPAAKYRVVVGVEVVKRDIVSVAAWQRKLSMLMSGRWIFFGKNVIVSLSFLVHIFGK